MNAYATAAGDLFIHRDVITKLRDDPSQLNMIAFMLAHEVAHITKRHTVKELQINLTDYLVTFSDIKAVLSGKSNAESIANAIRHVISSKKLRESYNINQEHEADVCAIRLLADQHNIDAKKGAHDFLEMQRKHGEQSKPHPSHPLYKDRKKLIDDTFLRYANERLDMSNSQNEASSLVVAIKKGTKKSPSL